MHTATFEDEVKEWIIKNALGTRNLTEMQITDLRGRLLKTMKGHRRATAERGTDGKFHKSEKATSGDVAASIAKDLGINRNTVYEAANFVDGLDAAEAVVPGFKDAVLTGEVKAQKQEVAAMRKQTPEEIKKSVETIKERKGFPDRWAAIAWICANQLHKHNMTELQRMKLIQEEHDARQKTVGGQTGNENAKKQSDEIHHFVSDEPQTIRNGSPGKELKTRPTIAKEHGISESAVQTAVEVGRGIDRAAKGSFFVPAVGKG